MRALLKTLRKPFVRICAIAVLSGAFLAVAALHSAELKRERANYISLLKTNHWALNQLQWELERFLAALDRYALAPDAGQSFEALSLRFDILWSRAPVLLQGLETEEVRKIEGATALVEDFRDSLVELESALAALEAPPDRPASYRLLRETLEGYRQPLHALALDLQIGDYAQGAIATIVRSHSLSLQYQLMLLVVAALLVLHLSLEVLFSIRQARREHAARLAAEAADKAKANFLGVISHELRTPLNAIVGFSELQRTEAFGPMPARYRGYAEDIHASAAYLLGILNNVLDLVKLDAQKMELRETVFDPADPVREAIRMIQPDGSAAKHELRFANHLEGKALYGDRHLYQQIALNLLSNAVKFAPEGGLIEVALTGEKGDLILSVTDSGPGVAPELVARMTEPFFQVLQDQRLPNQGAGLGLALVKGFADLHGARVRIETRPGDGTRVGVRFPPERVRDTEVRPAGEAASLAG